VFTQDKYTRMLILQRSVSNDIKVSRDTNSIKGFFKLFCSPAYLYAASISHPSSPCRML